VHYCGVVPMQRDLQLALLEEVRDPEPPIRLSALFYEPGPAARVAEELRKLGHVVVGIGAPLSGAHPEVDTLVELLGVRTFEADEERGLVPDGAYREAPVFSTDPDQVFYALQGRRLPAKRHPYGIQLRIHELMGDHVADEGGDLWHRRIEEIDAVACALCAHRYAVGHASWRSEGLRGMIVLPGTSVPETFPITGVMPPVERIQLPGD
jgi:hypothetical protein